MPIDVLLRGLRWLFVLLLLGALLLGFISGCSWLAGWVVGRANAHDAEHRTDWIGQSRATNGKGDLCCGWNDCEVLDSADVIDRKDGVYIKSLDELVPYSEVQPSPDKNTYRCAWGVPSVECRGAE